MPRTRSTIMLVALRVAREAPALPTDCVRRLRASQQRGDDEPDLEERVWKAFADLCVAGLLDPDGEGRCTLTERGAAALREHPMGIDDSVLERFPEYRAYIRDSHSPTDEPPRQPVAEPKPEYLEGVAAFQHGADLEENPYPQESRKHVDWRDGWSEALISAPEPRARE